MNLTLIIALAVIGAGLSAYRLVKGPSTMDRVVSVDTMNMMVVGVIAMLALEFKNILYLDIAMVYGVLAFLETVIIAKYMESRQ